MNRSNRSYSVLIMALFLFLFSFQMLASAEGEIIEIEDEEVPLANVDTVLDGNRSYAVLGAEDYAKEVQNTVSSGNRIPTFKAVSGKSGITSISIQIDGSAAAEMLIEGKGLTIISDLGQFTMDQKLIKTIAAVEGDVILTAEIKEPLELDEDVDAEMSVYLLRLTDEADNEIDFNGGSMTVTLPWDGKSTKVAYLDDTDGRLVEIDDAVFNRGNVTFTTTHFTTWILYFESGREGAFAVSHIMVGIGLCLCVIVFAQIGKAVRRNNT